MVDTWVVGRIGSLKSIRWNSSVDINLEFVWRGVRKLKFMIDGFYISYESCFHWAIIDHDLNIHDWRYTMGHSGVNGYRTPDTLNVAILYLSLFTFMILIMAWAQWRFTLLSIPGRPLSFKVNLVEVTKMNCDAMRKNSLQTYFNPSLNNLCSTFRIQFTSSAGLVKTQVLYKSASHMPSCSV